TASRETASFQFKVPEVRNPRLEALECPRTLRGNSGLFDLVPRSSKKYTIYRPGDNNCISVPCRPEGGKARLPPSASRDMLSPLLKTRLPPQKRY
ncbi:hypothetical protein V6O07_06945, partial [Arthrospira platensis SPKY2]